MIVALVPVVILVVGVLLDVLGASTVLSDRDELPAMFLTMGEVLGAVAGLLFAVIVFSVESQINRAGPLAPLTKFLHRSSGLMPDAAFVMGVIVASVVVAFWMNNGLPGYGNAFEFLLVALFVGAIAITLGHFCRIIRDATGDLFSQLRDAILPHIDD